MTKEKPNQITRGKGEKNNSVGFFEGRLVMMCLKRRTYRGDLQEERGNLSGRAGWPMESGRNKGRKGGKGGKGGTGGKGSKKI